ncbi:ADP-ribosylglycohydrolase family protein [Pelodictyon luteolum]|nr:ADP-ribosylglycohydrolase family protein [Pelodictyon luteolum]
MKETEGLVARAQGCLLGQLTGDALGALAEFAGPRELLQHYPNGLREIVDGGAYNTIAGQPTDDSEMALVLAATLAGRKTYSEEHAMAAYRWWWESEPFDYGRTIMSAMLNMHDHESQANGALMRISPLGIFCSRHSLADAARWAKDDAALTHPHPIVGQANALFVMAIAHAVKKGPAPAKLYRELLGWMDTMDIDPKLASAVRNAAAAPPENYGHPVEGWVLVALQNAFYQLLHAESLEEGVVDTLMQGGDTDTNAAVCGALLGAVYGIDAIPEQWKAAVLNCRPEAGMPGVHHPRPKELWPQGALELAEGLVTVKRGRVDTMVVQ